MKYGNLVKKPASSIDPVCKKKAYFSREEAEDMIRHISDTRVTREISAYECDVCGLWHMTSRTRKK